MNVFKDRRERSSIYPMLLRRWKSSFFKPANDLLAIRPTSSLRLFHSFTTLLLEEYFAISSPTLFVCNFNWWRLKLDFDRTKNISSQMSSYFKYLKYLYIKSPLSFLVSSVVKNVRLLACASTSVKVWLVCMVRVYAPCRHLLTNKSVKTSGCDGHKFVLRTGTYVERRR